MSEHLSHYGITTTGIGTRIRGTRIRGTGIRGTVHATVHATVPVMTLHGHTDKPGHPEGCRLIDPDTAREIAARAPSITRILTHPNTEVVLSMKPDRNQEPKDLRRHLRVQDETCQ